MSTVRCINFWDLCRICTASSEHKINIYSPEGRAKNLGHKISECLPVQINEKDRLPKVVCGQCAQQVEQMYEMRNISKNSQTILSNWLNHRSLQCEDKVFIKDAVNESGKSLNVVGQAAFGGQAAGGSGVGSYQNNDLLSSIMQAVGMQVQQQQSQQYTITVDNQVQGASHPPPVMPQVQPEVKSEKQNTLEEFIRLKPDIKITPLSKKETSAQGVTTSISQIKQQQTQPQQQLPQQQQLQAQTLTAVSAPAAQIQLQPQQLNELNVLLQQQALIQQLQQLQAQTQTQLTNCTDDAMSSVDNKKPKLNFVLSSPTATPQFASSLQQFGGVTGTQPQIQLQLLPGGVSGNTASSSGITAAQPPQQFNAAALLSSLTGSQVVGGNASVNMLSPNKCFLPITIRDENSDQQIVAHIDTKNLMLPTTYQVQMKLQPQLATADGQPIMQLTPTSIPATLQLTPQTSFQPAAVSQPNQLLMPQTQPQLQPNPPQQQLQLQQQTQQQLPPQQTHQQQLAPAQAQVTSQQIIRSPRANVVNPQLVIRNVGTDLTTPTSSSTTDGSVIFKTPSPRQQPAQQQVKFKSTPSSVSSNNAGSLELNKRPALVKQQPTIASSNVAALQRLSSHTTITKLTKPQSSGASNKMPLLTKQNITISRIPAQAPSKLDSKVGLTATPQSSVSASTPAPTQASPKSQSTPPPALSLQVSQPSAVVTSIANQRKITRKPPEQQPNQRSKTGRPQQQILPVPAQQTTTQPPQQHQPVTNSLVCDTSTPASAPAGGVPYLNLTCPTCLREFKKKEHLTQHVKLHAGLRPFKCTEDGCDKAFSRKEHLSRHLVSHSGQKMFTCEDCKKPFSRKDNLNKHKRTHNAQPSEIRLHSCEICNKNFASKQHYEKHRAMHKKTRLDNPPANTQATRGEQEAAKSQEVYEVKSTESAPPQTQHSQTQIQQQQQPQIMHVDLDGSTITITQASDSNMQTSLANFVQLGFSQFQNSSPANQIVCKLEK